MSFFYFGTLKYFSHSNFWQLRISDILLIEFSLRFFIFLYIWTVMLSNTNINRVLLKRGNVLTQIADTLNSIEKPNDEEKARIHPSEFIDLN